MFEIFVSGINECFVNLEFLKNFINPSKSSVSLEEHAQLLSVGEQVAKLSEGIEALNKELQRQVAEKHEDLLFHANWIEKLEEVLEMMSVHMQVNIFFILHNSLYLL